MYIKMETLTNKIGRIYRFSIYFSFLSYYLITYISLELVLELALISFVYS